MIRQHSKRAIGELLGAIIVISVTIIAGVLVYGVVMGRISTIGYTAEISINSATVVNDQAFVTVKNTGTYTLSSGTVTVYYSGNSVGFANFGQIAPGQTVSVMTSLSASGFTYSPREEFTIYVNATSAGGSTTATTAVIGQ